MKQYLCPFIEAQVERFLEEICRVIPENEANYKRGLIKMAKDILAIPQVIKNRMEVERNPQYKEFMAEAAKELM